MEQLKPKFGCGKICFFAPWYDELKTKSLIYK